MQESGLRLHCPRCLTAAAALKVPSAQTLEAQVDDTWLLAQVSSCWRPAVQRLVEQLCLHEHLLQAQQA